VTPKAYTPAWQRARGAGPDARPEGDSFTALMIASYTGHTDCVAALLSAGADPNASGGSGHTPLIYACQCGHAASVSLLLEAGANPRATALGEWTPLHQASYWGRPPVVRQLLAIDPSLAPFVG